MTLPHRRRRFRRLVTLSLRLATRLRALATLVALVISVPPLPVWAAVAEPDGRTDDAFDVMNVLAARGWHDLVHERWNIYGQATWISSLKAPFAAQYTNLDGANKSLLPSFEHSFTGTATLFLGLGLWPGAQLHLVPEVISERPLSDLSGLGGAIQNFELQKTGSAAPTLYRSRFFLRQVIGLGGDQQLQTSDPMQLGAEVDGRRVVVTLGNLSVLDVFDKNAFAGDLRRQFFNMAFLTHAAYDFAADARGYSWGGVVEVVYDDWTVRAGRFAVPVHPNQLDIDFSLQRHYGDQVEVERRHTWRGQPGAVRLLGYRNHENIAGFAEAIAVWRADPAKNAQTCAGFHYDSENAGAPDLCWARRDSDKFGVGVNVEQQFGPNLGLFARVMQSDGQSEVYSYTSADGSASVGALGKGGAWHRASDQLGLGLGLSWISNVHADFLSLGGVDGFVGDGKLRRSAEGVAEAFYSVNLAGPTWIALDYQFIFNPGYNADRGPVHVFGARFHGEL